MRLWPWLLSAAFAVVLTPTQTFARPLPASAVKANAAATIPFIVHLPLRNSAELTSLVALQATPGSQVYHQWLSPAQFRARYGATAAAAASASAGLRAAGLSVDRLSSQFITAHGSVAQVERAFGVQLRTYRGTDGRAHTASAISPTAPASLRALGVTIEGLTYHGELRPQMTARPQSTIAPPLNGVGNTGPFLTDQLKEAYGLPAYGLATGRGVTVATVNLADFSNADLKQYLQSELIGNAKNDLAPLPNVTHVVLPGADPFSPDDSDSAEADLDTQLVAGTAPGAHLVGWDGAISIFPGDFLQVYDAINETNSADIVSTSYGICELLFTTAYNGVDDTPALLALHDVFLQGNSQGITYLVSSGDGGGYNCPPLAYYTNPVAGASYPAVPGLDSPADDPNVVAVGGGNLITTGSLGSMASKYLAENGNANALVPSDIYGEGALVTNMWFGATGGSSVVFAKPSWQNGVTPGVMRSDPDIGSFVGGCFSGTEADTGFVEPCPANVSHAVSILGGQEYQVIGTSIAAPFTAGALALVEQLNGSGTRPGAGRLGNLNVQLYTSPSALFHTSIPGFNGAVSVPGGARWNPIYGLGSLFNADPFSAVAGTPETPSNP